MQLNSLSWRRRTRNQPLPCARDTSRFRIGLLNSTTSPERQPCSLFCGSQNLDISSHQHLELARPTLPKSSNRLSPALAGLNPFQAHSTSSNRCQSCRISTSLFRPRLYSGDSASVRTAVVKDNRAPHSKEYPDQVCSLAEAVRKKRRERTRKFKQRGRPNGSRSGASEL